MSENKDNNKDVIEATKQINEDKIKYATRKIGKTIKIK